MDDSLLFKDEVYRIVGAAMGVSNELGCGFLEGVYQEALGLEFGEVGIAFEAQKTIEIAYKGKVLNKTYIADFVCFGCIIVEIKAIKKITSIEEAQLMNYLAATKLAVGLIINFGNPQMEWRRYACTRNGARMNTDDGTANERE